MNTFQYGIAQSYESIEGSELTIDGLCSWLELMSFEYSYEDISEGMRLLISNNIQIDIHCEDNVIFRMDLIIKNIENGYGNDITISVAK